MPVEMDFHGNSTLAREDMMLFGGLHFDRPPAHAVVRLLCSDVEASDKEPKSAVTDVIAQTQRGEE